jgi:hypothetical protein
MENRPTDLPANVITLPNLNFYLEKRIKNRYRNSRVVCLEIDKNVFEKQQDILRSIDLKCEARFGDVFQFINELGIRNYLHAIQFDLCCGYSPVIHENLISAVTNGCMADNAIFSLTTSWNQQATNEEHKKFFRSLWKKYCTIQYSNMWIFRNYRLPEIIVAACKERGVTVDYLGCIAYKSTGKGGNQGKPMQFQMFKIKH